MIDEQTYKPTGAQFRLGSLDFIWDRSRIPVDLEWNQDLRSIRFQVKACRPGSHKAEIVLFTDGKQKASVALQSDAIKQDEAIAGAGEGLTPAARVQVIINVRERERSREVDRERSLDRQRGMDYGSTRGR